MIPRYIHVARSYKKDLRTAKKIVVVRSRLVLYSRTLLLFFNVPTSNGEANYMDVGGAGSRGNFVNTYDMTCKAVQRY
jgi:hypothetical protein